MRRISSEIRRMAQSKRYWLTSIMLLTPLTPLVALAMFSALTLI
jgi:hypothetical protein